MSEAHEHRSEVARILDQIRAEYEAAQRGLTGLSSGSSQHAFITARMENMSLLRTQLHDLIGDDASSMLAKQLETCPDPTPHAAAEQDA